MIDHRANELLSQAEKLIAAKRFKTALPMLEDVAVHSTDPALRMMVSYNLGAIQWAELCDGREGRRWFQTVVAISPGVIGFKPGLKERMTANACENMMLLSLSFDEHEQWAARLAKLQPENHILHQQLPEFRRLRERGHSWSMALRGITQCYYDRNDPAQDRGRYGEAASTFHLLLCNRKSLRIAREDWRLILYEYGALSMRVSEDHLLRLKGTDPHEYLFVLLNAMPHVEEYVKRYPADRVIDGLYSNMRCVASQFERASSTATAPPRVPTAPFPGGTFDEESDVPAQRSSVLDQRSVAMGCAFGFAGMLVGAGIGWWLYEYSGIVGVLLGAAAGLFIANAVGLQIGRTMHFIATHCAVCGRRFEKEPRPAGFEAGFGVMVHTADLMSGLVGSECVHCERTCCSTCGPAMPCTCGSTRYRSVKLRYDV